MPRRTQRQKKKDGKGFALALVVALGAVGVFVAAAVYMARTRLPELDARLCPISGPLGHTILLVDKTDPLSFTQKQGFDVRLTELIERQIPKGALLSVFVLGEDFEKTAQPLVERCNPGDGSDKSELTSNLGKLRAQYQQAFVKPLLEVSDQLVATKPSKYSPIFEMLQLVGINGFRKSGAKGDLKLIVMSDMLQNTPGYSMFRGDIDYEAFAATPYGIRSQASLPNVSVELQYLMDTPQLQTKRNLLFWERYFDKAGAHIVRVQPLEG